MRKLVLLVLMFTLVISVPGCHKETEKPELLFYIGITMVKPVMELKETFEAEHDCIIRIVQGGSQDLYDSLKTSEEGDLYMPGSYSYRLNNLEDGLLLDAVLVGYNKASLVVKEGNPLGFSNDLSQLADKNIKVVICNPDSGSIGSETKKILDAYGNYEDVFDNAIYLTTDSRNLTDAIVDGDAELCINWFATTVWEDNVDLVDAILIDEIYAEKKMLIMNLIKTSRYPDLTLEFMAYASSEHGKSVFKKYGFIDDEDLEIMDKVEFK
ncbi:MAG: substrate-binding domain-containing protein [Clostridia bacterium]|nr:substrate-binding domain-containing protein [Clostridia bacterium]